MLAPLKRSNSFLFFKNKNVGIDLTPYRAAISGFLSTSTLMNITFLFCFSIDIASYTGAMALQGPHQVALKSTTTCTKQYTEKNRVTSHFWVHTHSRPVRHTITHSRTHLLIPPHTLTATHQIILMSPNQVIKLSRCVSFTHSTSLHRPTSSAR